MRALQMRLKYQFFMQKLLIIASCILILFSIIVLATGVKFANNDLFHDGKDHSFNKVTGGMVGFLAVFFLIMIGFAACGIQLGRMAKPPNAGVMGFGIGVFFLVSLPMFIEGGIIKSWQEITPENVDDICDI